MLFNKKRFVDKVVWFNLVAKDNFVVSTSLPSCSYAKRNVHGVVGVVVGGVVVASRIDWVVVMWLLDTMCCVIAFRVLQS